MVSRILVLDDSQDLLETVEEKLLLENFQVLVTSDGQNLLEIARIFRPDLFILDYKLSGSKSSAICRQIKWHPQFSRVPVILSSTYFHTTIDYRDMGCDGVIAKPFGLSDLVGTVNQLSAARA